MSSRRVLIIDADQNSGEALREMIAGWNYEVLLAQDKSEGLAGLEETTPSVIITASSASSADAFSLLREIRALQTDTPVVLLAGHGSIEMALNAIQQEGAYYYFEKPVDADKLRIV